MMLFEDNCADAELLNGDIVEVYFNFTYTPGITGNRSGHPDTWEPDEPEEYEITDIKFESKIFGLAELSTENESYVMGCLLEKAKEVYEAWAEARQESNAEDRQELMNIATGFMNN